MNFKEIEQCAKCGLCLAACPIYKELILERYSPRGKVQLASFYEKGDLELSDSYRESFSKCLLCGACKLTCPGGIDPNAIVEQMRKEIVSKKGLDDKQKGLVQSLLEHHNISGEDNEERGDWREYLEDLPDHGYLREQAEIVFFVGCVSSFYPMVQKIPQNMVRIMERAGADFTILGGQEYCCGYPLIGAGLPDKAGELMDHNIRKIKDTNAEKIVFSCPTCYLTWKQTYDTDIELLHTTQFIHSLIKEGRLRFRDMGEIKVTYHDPCDLGRKGGIFGPPRRIIESIPSLNLVEMANNRMNSICCGGGGNLETDAEDLVEILAQKKVDDIKESGVDMVVSACQQCVRTIATRARRQKTDLKVMDITELVCQAMEY